MTHSDVTEDLANNKEKGEEIQQAQAGPAVTDQVPTPTWTLPYLLLFILLSVLWIRIRIRSGFSGVPGSGSGFAIWIRIQEDKMVKKK
jgi:hypothetical protein